MAARAIWKGALVLGEERVPLKLYSGVEDRSAHFRLLHEPDGVPVSPFDPGEWHDSWRNRVLELIEAQAEGHVLELREVRQRREGGASLEDALAASLERAEGRESA